MDLQNKVLITLSESDFKSMILNGVLTDIKYSVKILPNESDLINDAIYLQLKKNYRKSFDDLNKYVFEKLTNK